MTYRLESQAEADLVTIAGYFNGKAAGLGDEFLGDLLISVSATSGIRRLSVSQGANDWSIEERWTSTGLKTLLRLRRP